MSAMLRWLLRGQRHTEQGFADQGAAIRALQEQVEQLRRSVAELEHAGGTELVDASRAAVRAAIDDLGHRIDALTARLDQDA